MGEQESPIGREHVGLWRDWSRKPLASIRLAFHPTEARIKHDSMLSMPEEGTGVATGAMKGMQATRIRLKITSA